MIVPENDPDVVRWGLHLLDICCISNGGTPSCAIHYDKDLSQTEYVIEGYCEANLKQVENDEIIARAFQEELSKVAATEAFGSSDAKGDHLQASVLAQDWQGPMKEQHNCVLGNDNQKDMDDRGSTDSCSCIREESLGLEEGHFPPEIEDESTLDGEVGKRMNEMVPIPHVPKINGEIPSYDEEISDHQRLLDRLQVYELVELKVQGDGNCQFRALSDQIYRTAEHHKSVRQEVVDQYGVKVFIITSFRDTCYIEILPHTPKSKRIIFLSFWAEVHYNSIYPEGELPVVEAKKKKKWWML